MLIIFVPIDYYFIMIIKVIEIVSRYLQLIIIHIINLKHALLYNIVKVTYYTTLQSIIILFLFLCSHFKLQKHMNYYEF